MGQDAEVEKEKFSVAWVGSALGSCWRVSKREMKWSGLYFKREGFPSVFCSYYRALSEDTQRHLSLMTMTLVAPLPATRGIIERCGVYLGGKSQSV